MQLSVEQVDDVAVVVLDGQLDGNTADDTLAFFQANCAGDCKKYIADFRRVDYISSAGIRVLMRVLDELRRTNGDLRIAATQRNVHRVFAATGFLPMLRSFDNVESGIESYCA